MLSQYSPSSSTVEHATRAKTICKLRWLQALCRQFARVGRSSMHSWQRPPSAAASGMHMALCSPAG